MKTLLSIGLALLALTSIIILATDSTLTMYQQCFLVGTMSVSALVVLGIERSRAV